MFATIYSRFKFWNKCDRIGIDIPATFWKLYFKNLMIRLCKEKFNYFDDSAEFRPGGLAVGCSQIRIGKKVVIRPGTMLHAADERLKITLIIEDYVMLGSGIHIYVNDHSYERFDIPIIEQGYKEPITPVHLKHDCYIGANSIILPGVVLGEHSVVAAGSVVSGEIPPYSIVVGNPARVVRKRK